MPSHQCELHKIFDYKHVMAQVFIAHKWSKHLVVLEFICGVPEDFVYDFVDDGEGYMKYLGERLSLKVSV